MSVIALERYLDPLKPYLSDQAVTEICINQPGEVFVESDSQFHSYVAPQLDQSWLETLAMLIAEFNRKDYPAPLIAGKLPTGERVQVVMNPACEDGKVLFSIRRQRMKNMTLADYAKSGAFDRVIKSCHPREALSDALLKCYHEQSIEAFLKEAIKQKRNVVISGGTGTGKTTFLNSCLALIPEHERILTVEDTREVSVRQTNTAHLLFDDNDSRMTALEIFKACLRLRPDRILLSELRGKEVWPYLRAANSGHPGSLTTVHADTPEGAFMQLMFMMQQAGSTSTEEQIMRYIKSIIHVVVQLKRDDDPQSNRFMYVDQVWISNL